MKRRLLLGSMVFMLVIGLMVACASQPTSPSPVTDVKIIKVLISAFGTGGYNMYAGVEKLSAQHPRIRVSVIETPGFTYNVKLMADNNAKARWPDTVFGFNSVFYSAGKAGTDPFDKPNALVQDMRQLHTYSVFPTGLVTLNKDLADIKSLDGKRIALGKAAQTSWAFTPEWLLKEAFGLKPKIDYLGPSEAVAALLDGRADAAVLGVYCSGDLKSNVEAPSTMELIASGRKFYYVRSDKATMEAALKRTGLTLFVVDLPPNTLSSQSEQLSWLSCNAGLAAHKSFPEDVAYDFTKLMLDNYKELPKYEGTARAATPATFVAGYPAELFHPGALKAYKEAGVWNK